MGKGTVGVEKGELPKSERAGEADRNRPLALWQQFNQAEPRAFPCTNSILCVHLQIWLLAHSLCLGS